MIVRQVRRMSMDRGAELRANYDRVIAQIHQARLVVVSKYKPASDIQELYNHGVRHFGENYVQELVGKAAELPNDIQWHFIGSCQSNKCKQLAQIDNLYAVETVDSESKCNKLNNGRNEGANKLAVFIQVNTSGEDQKNGISVGDTDAIVKIVKHVQDSCPNLIVKGLMTIGSFESSTTEGEENTDFSALSAARDAVVSSTGASLELSMGMSNDYIQALKQGSDNVRVGSAIFGARKTKDEMKQ